MSVIERNNAYKSLSPQMKTAAGQCCFYTVPERDALGIGRHYAVRTYETLCDDWLVLHKARSLAPRPSPELSRAHAPSFLDVGSPPPVQVWPLWPLQH